MGTIRTRSGLTDKYPPYHPHCSKYLEYDDELWDLELKAALEPHNIRMRKTSSHKTKSFEDVRRSMSEQYDSYYGQSRKKNVMPGDSIPISGVSSTDTTVKIVGDENTDYWTKEEKEYKDVWKKLIGVSRFDIEGRYLFDESIPMLIQNLDLLLI